MNTNQQSSVFTVIIQPCTDTTGYWAKCDMPGGGCTVQGETLHETQKLMLEAIEFYLEDMTPMAFEVRYA